MEEKSKLLVLTMLKNNSSRFQVISSQPSNTTQVIDKATQEKGTSTAKRRSNCLSKSKKDLTRIDLSCKARARRGEQPCLTIQLVDNKTQCLTQLRSETLKIASKSAIQQWKKRMIRAYTITLRVAFCRVRCSRHRTKIYQLKVPSRAMGVYKYKVKETCSQIGST